MPHFNELGFKSDNIIKLKAIKNIAKKTAPLAVKIANILVWFCFIQKQLKPIVSLAKKITSNKSSNITRTKQNRVNFYQIVLFVVRNNQVSLKIKKKVDQNSIKQYSINWWHFDLILLEVISFKWTKSLTIFGLLEASLCPNLI